MSLDEDFQRFHKKKFSQFKADAKIKECFHFDNSTCKGSIVAAHSIQQNGVLNILAQEVKGNKGVYGFNNLALTPMGAVSGLNLIGTKVASTFTGFCGFHDALVFGPIENHTVDPENDEHCFLLSYRGFAKEYHAKKETNKGFATNEMYNKPHNAQKQADLILGSQMAIDGNEPIKKRMNQILNNGNFSELEYLTYSLDYCIPVACSSTITPAYSYNGDLLNKSEDPADIYEHVMINVLPTKTETHIILSCLPENGRSMTYLNQLESLNDVQLEKAITSILIGEVENMFIAPSVYNRLTSKEQLILMRELTYTMPPIQSMHSNFFHTKLNFFEPRFSIK
jgi:hypothetical protein